jgi:3-deoxy-7-phosphoheptulonate synthase
MYRRLAEKVDDALRFIKAIGVDTTSAPFISTDFFISHEALLLPYEEV